MGAADLLTPIAVGVAVVALLAVVALAVLLVRARRENAELREERAATAAGAQRRLAGFLAAGRDGVVLHSPAGRVLEVNEAAARILGAPTDVLVGRAVDRLPVRWVDESERQVPPSVVFARRHATDPDGAPPPEALAVGVRTDAPGSPVRWLQVSTRAVPAAGGSYELFTYLADMTGPREIRAALARSETQFQAAMENASIGMAVASPQWILEQVNPAFAAFLGREPAALVGRDLSAHSDPHERAAERAQVNRLLAGEDDRFTLEKRYQRADGQTVWGVLDAVLVRTPEGAPDQFVIQLQDVTESRMHAEMLAHRAVHDPLTGLANRSLLQEVLQSALEEPGIEGRLAVLVIDLDEFKQVNDRYGHPAGDEVLVHVAGVLRAATAGRGTVARIGGDEFVVLVQDPDCARVVFEIASNIHNGLRVPVRTQHRPLSVGASIGVAVAEQAVLAKGAVGLLAAADAALYRAKDAGRGRTEVFDTSMSMTASARHGAGIELENAIDAGQLVLHYQPVVDLSTAQVVGHEALVRWEHPERGLLLPGSFLATAEETGLGVALGASVVTQAAAFLARTADDGGWVSVNVSADQLGDGLVTARVLEESARHGVAPGRLVVELTEASLVATGTRIRQELVQLREAGVPVLLDDFGTGVSPLSYLRDLPINGVKLDMSFAAGIPADPGAARAARALGALARELDMITIAEGIETAEQAEYLRRCGWRYGQGWLFGAGQSEPVVGG